VIDGVSDIGDLEELFLDGILDETRRSCHLPVAPPVITATIPSTEYKFAALRESILRVCDMLDEYGLGDYSPVCCRVPEDDQVFPRVGNKEYQEQWSYVIRDMTPEVMRYDIDSPAKSGAMSEPRRFPAM